MDSSDYHYLPSYAGLFEKLSVLKGQITFDDEDEEADFNNCIVDLRTKLVLKVRTEDDHTQPPKRGWLEKERTVTMLF